MSASDEPQHYRMRAADMRTRAERAEAPATKDGLQRIARDFDLLAQRAEERLAAMARLSGAEPAAASATPANLDPAKLTA